MPLLLGSRLPFTVLGQCLDKYWTRQTKDKTQIQWPTLGSLTDIGYCLDNYGIWKDSCLILDLIVFILISRFLLTDLGQRLDKPYILYNSAWALVALSQ